MLHKLVNNMPGDFVLLKNKIEKCEEHPERDAVALVYGEHINTCVETIYTCRECLMISQGIEIGEENG